jgi:hypothetical protein
MRTPDGEMTVPRDKPSEPPGVQAAGSSSESAPKHLHGSNARFEQTVLLRSAPRTIPQFGDRTKGDIVPP